MSTVPPVVEAFSTSLKRLEWVRGLLVAGSLASGDYVPSVSDVDLVAVTIGPVDGAREQTLLNLHREVDGSSTTQVGCTYVARDLLAADDHLHPVWTHGRFVRRRLSEITRAELVRFGVVLFGDAPASLLPPMSDEDVRRAAVSELRGYWAWASRRPWMWLDPEIADLGLISMARATYTAETGLLLTKSEALEQLEAPSWLVGQLRARRRGEPIRSPRLRAGWVAWRLARRTVRRLSVDNGRMPGRHCSIP